MSSQILTTKVYQLDNIITHYQHYSSASKLDHNNTLPLQQQIRAGKKKLILEIYNIISQLQNCNVDLSVLQVSVVVV